MVSDSPYDAGELIGRPGAGAAAGVVAAVVMLALLAGLAGPDSARAWIDDVGKVLLPAPLRTATSLAIAGSIVHLAVGGLIGALYAACQQRTSTSGVLVVGAFYGFVVWLVGYLVLARLLNAGPRLLPTSSGLLVMLAYGLVLAAWAVREQKASARLVRQAGPVD
jgi:hypothetical protein